ncbi:MAG: OmpP1/FadL family transporter [Candidatus Binatia bacterium]
MRRVWCEKRALCIVILTVLGMCLPAVQGQASYLVVGAAGPEDGSMEGNVVALPLNPVSALFHNPAQLTLLPESATMGAQAIPFRPRYANSQGYDNTSRELPLAPSFGYVTDRWAPFHVGIGSYGSLGFAYNFDADPARGVPNNFFTELAVISLAPAVAYSLAPNLHIGFALNPSYGRLRLKTPSPIGRLDLDVRGFGIFSTVGVLYTPTPKLNLGISYKTPGIILMRGNARVGGRGDDAKVDFYTPSVLEFGAAYRLTPRLTLTSQGWWTEYSAFEDTNFQFDRATALNGPAVGDARDRLRVGAGIQYALFSNVTLHGGFSWERWAIKAGSVSPALPDWTNYFFAAGVSIDYRQWTFHLLGGYAYIESRNISADRNPFFAGRYRLDELPTLMGIQVTRRLGKVPSSE